MKRLVNTSSSSTLEWWVSGRWLQECSYRGHLEGGDHPELDAEVVLVVRGVEEAVDCDGDECGRRAPQQRPREVSGSVEAAPAAPAAPQEHAQDGDESG